MYVTAKPHSIGGTEMTRANQMTLVPRKEETDNHTLLTPYGHILVALDGSELAERVFAYVEPLTKAFGSQVTCLCAVEPISTSVLAGTGMPGGYTAIDQLLEGQEEVRAEDAAYLGRIKERLGRQGIVCQCVEPKERAADAIVEAARKYRINIIAMTTHGRSGRGRALLGSVADEVVRKAPCPVLLVRLPH